MEQSKLLQHATTIYLSHTIADFAEALAAKMPGNLKVSAILDTFRFVYLQLLHGNMITYCNLIDASGSDRRILQGEIHHVINPNPYRGIFGSDPTGYAKDVQDHVDYGTSGKVAGFISETIQGVGGAVELAPRYLTMVYDIERKAGGVCIADEVQSGFGHTGSHYWGFETQGVIPDIVTMAKGIGNGLPLGAIVTTPEIAQVMAQKIQFSTFGGNPVCSAGGHEVLRVIDQERRQEHCADVGSHMLGRRKRRLPAKAKTAILFEKLRDFLVGAFEYSMLKLINNGPVVSGYSARKHLSVNVVSDD
ncbi:hypothetical protein POTOM_020883 [Populus tomentosa]|uniref:Uncharacterized protein n=1 Tax=Populus tomentosa TaxID=118781 RepID=A0A8X7ZPH4_POPTO|nr:hypothetical protein POTOM_020883 [Populus tomentosa]